MSESPIQHVTDTAFWIATYRAREGERKDALFSDPLAARLTKDRGAAIAAKMGDAEAVAWSVVVRTCIIDEYILAEIAQGCDTVLNLGAGLDTRPYRLTLPPSLRWIEVDFPDTIHFKEEELKDQAARCALRRVPLDLSQGSERARLFAEVGAAAKHVLVLTEGVVPYLSCDEVSALATDLYKQPQFRRWIIDYFSPIFMTMTRRARHRRRMGQAPFKFYPPDWEAFFSSHGFTVHKMRYMGEEGRRFGRPPPAPAWLKFVLRLGPRRWWEVLKKTSGYALLERRKEA